MAMKRQPSRWIGAKRFAGNGPSFVGERSRILAARPCPVKPPPAAGPPARPRPESSCISITCAEDGRLLGLGWLRLTPAYRLSARLGAEIRLRALATPSLIGLRHDEDLAWINQVGISDLIL